MCAQNTLTCSTIRCSESPARNAIRSAFWGIAGSYSNPSLWQDLSGYVHNKHRRRGAPQTDRALCMRLAARARHSSRSSLCSDIREHCQQFFPAVTRFGIACSQWASPRPANSAAPLVSPWSALSDQSISNDRYLKAAVAFDLHDDCLARFAILEQRTDIFNGFNVGPIHRSNQIPQRQSGPGVAVGHLARHQDPGLRSQTRDGGTTSVAESHGNDAQRRHNALLHVELL